LQRIRREIPPNERDSFMAPDLKSAEDLVRSGELVRAAGGAVGALE
jgi:hypothetical protein